MKAHRSVVNPLVALADIRLPTTFGPDPARFGSVETSRFLQGPPGPEVCSCEF